MAPSLSTDLSCTESFAAEREARTPNFEVVYREHFRTTWRLLRRLGVPPSQLDDAAQDVFLIVHRKLGLFDPGSSMKSWIFAIAVRVASEYRRRRARTRLELLEENIPDAAPTPAQRSETQSAIRLLHRLLETLDQDKRTVFVLAELEQLSAPEIADVLGENLNTVYSRLRRAKQAFEAAFLRVQPGGQK